MAVINAVSTAANKADACENDPQTCWTNTEQTDAGEINSSLANDLICVLCALHWHIALILQWLINCYAEVLFITWHEYSLSIVSIYRTVLIVYILHPCFGEPEGSSSHHQII